MNRKTHPPPRAVSRGADSLALAEPDAFCGGALKGMRAESIAGQPAGNVLGRRRAYGYELGVKIRASPF
jgi:hypothetical protein